MKHVILKRDNAGSGLRLGALTAVAALLLGAAPSDTGPRFAHWIDGSTPTEPKTQVQRIDDDSFVIRQSVRTNFEAPFLYLLFGTDRRLAYTPSGAAGPTDRRAFALARRSP
jgi:hypothetical protein